MDKVFWVHREGTAIYIPERKWGVRLFLKDRKFAQAKKQKKSLLAKRTANEERCEGAWQAFKQLLRKANWMVTSRQISLGPQGGVWIWAIFRNGNISCKSPEFPLLKKKKKKRKKIRPPCWNCDMITPFRRGLYPSLSQCPPPAGSIYSRHLCCHLAVALIQIISGYPGGIWIFSLSLSTHRSYRARWRLRGPRLQN